MKSHQKRPEKLLSKANSESVLFADSNSAPTFNPDVIVIGSGIGGLCAANILKHVHKKSVLVLESHYLPGGCAHSFPIKGYDFER